MNSVISFRDFLVVGLTVIVFLPWVSAFHPANQPRGFATKSGAPMRAASDNDNGDILISALEGLNEELDMMNEELEMMDRKLTYLIDNDNGDISTSALEGFYEELEMMERKFTYLIESQSGLKPKSLKPENPVCVDSIERIEAILSQLESAKGIRFDTDKTLQRFVPFGFYALVNTIVGKQIFDTSQTQRPREAVFCRALLKQIKNVYQEEHDHHKEFGFDECSELPTMNYNVFQVDAAIRILDAIEYCMVRANVPVFAEDDPQRLLKLLQNGGKKKDFDDYVRHLQDRVHAAYSGERDDEALFDLPTLMGKLGKHSSLFTPMVLASIEGIFPNHLDHWAHESIEFDELVCFWKDYVHIAEINAALTRKARSRMEVRVLFFDSVATMLFQDASPQLEPTFKIVAVVVGEDDLLDGTRASSHSI